MTDDAKLIEETLNGDREAFGLLIRKYQNPTYALVFQRIGSAPVAEEIAQDVFVTAYLKLGQLKDKSRFGAWLRSITLRRCAMWLRSQARKPSTHPLPADLAVVDPAGQGREAFFDVGALIRRLPEGLRAAAALCLEDELSPQTPPRCSGATPTADCRKGREGAPDPLLTARFCREVRMSM